MLCSPFMRNSAFYRFLTRVRIYFVSLLLSNYLFAYRNTEGYVETLFDRILFLFSVFQNFR
ncbi:hypothetical protein OLMES_2133 [Oleiphilus messinensis]|uniref:Uncharacterized protein n=1 Tax=Oleiphilus messinensis TaxID=141451 RepID=A0A1Y0I8V8_9GAMM|nr:hypothetical protein OLMES_2133 [Oleiphilus messinensis]